VYKPDIDEVLTRHMGRVTAPDELWERIENPQVSAGVTTRHARVRALLTVAAMVMVMALVFHPRRGTVEVEYRLPQHNLTLQVSKATQGREALNAACLLCHAGV
jgi:hypothetical protein